MGKRNYIALFAAVVLSMAAPVCAQDTEDAGQQAPSPASVGRFFTRRLEISNAEIGMRLKTEAADGQKVATKDAQYRIGTRIRFLLAPEGHTYIQSDVETGSSCLTGWTNSGIGQHPTAWMLNPRTLYIGQTIGSIAELQAGGLRFDQGAGTDNTYGAALGWVTGYRAIVGAPKVGTWLPNKLSVTVGYAGDFSQPNFFLRGYRMAEPNYVQVLGQKKISRHEASLEADSIQGVYFTRGAVHARNVAKMDNFTVDFIERVNLNQAFGWSTTMDRSIDQLHRWRAGVTYSDMPRKMFDKDGSLILLNSPGVTFGKVFGPGVHYAPVKTVDLFAYTSRRVDGDFAGSTRWRMQVGVKYQVTAAVNSLMNRLR